MRNQGPPWETAVQSHDILYKVSRDWTTAGYGVVSLLDMLDFAASSYVDLAYRFGHVLALGKPPDPDIVRDIWSNLLADTQRLDLPVTKEHVLEFLGHMAKENPGKVTLIGSPLTIQIYDATLPWNTMQEHVETIYKTLKAELRSIVLKAIPREKSKYCNPKWLTDTTLFQKFPESVDEFQKAGRCFAYSENTACVFHLMRVTDFYLRKVAESIGITYDARNWHGIGDKIAKNMEQKYQLKSDEWKKVEPFYAEILTDIQAIGRGHRNPALHELEQKYEEREAVYMLTVIESFAQHVADKL